jgi:hypothetical protein
VVSPWKSFNRRRDESTTASGLERTVLTVLPSGAGSQVGGRRGGPPQFPSPEGGCPKVRGCAAILEYSDRKGPDTSGPLLGFPTPSRAITGPLGPLREERGAPRSNHIGPAYINTPQAYCGHVFIRN